MSRCLLLDIQARVKRSSTAWKPDDIWRAKLDRAELAGVIFRVNRLVHSSGSGFSNEPLAAAIRAELHPLLVPEWVFWPEVTP